MIAEGPLLEALEAVHSGRLRVQEAYRQIRAAETADENVLTDREREALVDVAQWGIGELLDAVRSIEADPVATEDELDIAINYGVRADMGQRALDRLTAVGGAGAAS